MYGVDFEQSPVPLQQDQQQQDDELSTIGRLQFSEIHQRQIEELDGEEEGEDQAIPNK